MKVTRLSVFLLIFFVFTSMAIPQELLHHKFDMKRLKLGMSYDEVLRIEKRYNINEYDTRKQAVNAPKPRKNIIYYGVPMSLIYTFIYRTLVKAKYSVNYRYEEKDMKFKRLTNPAINVYSRKDIDPDQSMFIFLRDYINIQKGLEEDFGKPCASRVLWLDFPFHGDPFRITDPDIIRTVEIENVWKLETGDVIRHNLYTDAKSSEIRHFVVFKSILIIKEPIYGIWDE